MEIQITAAARLLAVQAGARLTVTPGVAYDTADPKLAAMAGALLEQVEGTGIDLLCLRREGETLFAQVDDSQAEEPLCPAAFHRVVRRLSHDLLGEVWDGRLVAEVRTAGPGPVELNRVA